MNDPFAIDSHKLTLHPQRVAQWLEAGDDWEKLKKVYPLYVEVGPQGACNHRCTFCAVDYIGYKPIHLYYNKLCVTFHDMAQHGVKSVMFSGEGEPLLYQDISKAIEFAKRVGLDVAVTTNATALTQRLAEESLANISWIKASINGGDRETYARIHQCPASHWDKVWDNLDEAVHIRNDNKWPTTIGAQTVLLPDNEASIDNLCLKARDTGLDYLVIKPYSQQPKSLATAERYGAIRYEGNSGERYKQYSTDSFKVIYREHTMSLLEGPPRYSKCQATPTFWAHIMANGDVYGCGAHLLDERFRFGNINTQFFSEIWEGDKRRQCVEFVRNELDIKECRKNCRMNQQNIYLTELKKPGPHANFI